MLNSVAINGALLGAGASNPWVQGSGYGTLRMYGGFANGITKYGSGSATLAIDGVLHSYRDVYVSIAGELGLGGSAYANVWTNKYVYTNGYLGLLGDLDAVYKRSATLSGDLVLSGGLTPSTYKVRHADPSTGYLRLLMQGTGYDLTTTPASADRTLGMIDLKTRELSAVPLGE